MAATGGGAGSGALRLDGASWPAVAAITPNALAERRAATQAAKLASQAAADQRVRTITSSLLLAPPGDCVDVAAALPPLSPPPAAAAGAGPAARAHAAQATAPYPRGDPYAPRTGDQLLDDIAADGADEELLEQDLEHVLESVWAFRASPSQRRYTPRKAPQPQTETPLVTAVTLANPLPVTTAVPSPASMSLLNSPVASTAATPFSSMRARLSGLSDAASAQSMRLGDWPTPNPLPIQVEVPVEHAADIKILSPAASPFASPFTSPIASPTLAPSPVAAAAAAVPHAPLSSLSPKSKVFAAESPTAPGRTPKEKEKATALGLLRTQQQQLSPTSSGRLSSLFSSVASTKLLAHGLASGRFRLREEEDLSTLDKRKEIAHAQWMKLVLRHVRTRLIQEGRFIEDVPGGVPAPTWEGDTNQFEASVAIRQRDRWRGDLDLPTHKRASSGMHIPSVERSPVPLDQLDVHMEVTGKPRPLPTPAPTPVAKRSIRGDPPVVRSKSGKPPTPLLSPYTRAKLEASKPDPLDPLPFHLDPLDPELPENALKRYKQNHAYEPPPGGEWPLDKRGPHHTWQELCDEEELAAYRKVLWLCEIKALAHVPLDGMLELIQAMVERAFDVEVLLRAGDPADPTGAGGSGSVFLIKSGEVELRMDRRIVEEMEEQRLIADLLSSSGGAAAGEQSLLAHPQPALAPQQQPAYSHYRLSTDPELLNKAVEIAQLGPLGIFGEDIIIATHRRYTVLSVTPLFAYEIKADALLKCFTDEAARNFQIAIAHTQRVRERHALVKGRTRLQYHAAPTMFRHFIDDPLQRQLGRKAQRPVPADPSAGVNLRNETMLTGGGPLALRAVLQDLNAISAASALHNYVPHSPERIEQMVQHAALVKDRHALLQRDLMKERQRLEAHGARSPAPKAHASQEEKQQMHSPQRQQQRKGSVLPAASSLLSPQIAPAAHAAAAQARGAFSVPQSSKRLGPVLPPPQFGPLSPPPQPVFPQRRSSIAALEPWPALQPLPEAVADQPQQADSGEDDVKPTHKRRITHMVTASGQGMYDSPFKAGSPKHFRQLSRSLSSLTMGALPVAAELPAASTPALPSPIVSPAPLVANRTQAVAAPLSPASSSSPFSMRFNIGSVFEKSPQHLRPGLVSFAATKQHVKRHTVVPLRTQHSAIVILGDLHEEQEYDMTAKDATSHHSPAPRRHKPNTLRTSSSLPTLTRNPTLEAQVAAQKPPQASVLAASKLLASAQLRQPSPST